MFEKMSVKKQVWILIALSYLFFIFGNSIVNLTNPDEVFYAQTAKEMVSHKTWMVPYLFDAPNFEKPIFTYWFLRIGYILFGVTNFGARFFCAFFAALGVIAVYFFSFLAFDDKKKAFLSALILMSSSLYLGLARTVFTDMIFTVLILFAFLSFFWGYVRSRRKTPAILLFFFFCGLATLTKGPLGFFMPLVAVLMFLALRRDLKYVFCLQVLWGFLLFSLTAVPWYWVIYKQFGQSFINEFFVNDHWRRVLEAEHLSNDHWYFYPLSMVACMFPWSIFVFLSFFHFVKKLKTKDVQPVYLYLLCWIAVVFIVFQAAHSKLVSYIFPLFPALAIIASDFMTDGKGIKARKFFISSIFSWSVLMCFPIALIVSSIKYASYAPPKIFLYSFVVLYVAQLMLMLFFILKRRFWGQIYMLVLQIPLLFYFFLFSHGQAANYLSSKEACRYLTSHYDIHNAIICSKPFMRGVRFYTDKQVVSMNMGGDNYFSPHPTVFLSTEGKLLSFLKAQPLSYAVLKKSDFSDLKDILVKAQIKYELLKVVGDEYLIRISAERGLVS
ncbi:MAG: phospholipid carrier-dependent glycosyltransferase [Candidatus Omnitrophota bacterium]